MKCYLLFFVIVILSPLNVTNANAGTVFSWVDSKGVMNFTDKKPAEIEVESDRLTTKDVKVTNILESETTNPKNVVTEEDNIQVKRHLNQAINQELNTNQVVIESDSEFQIAAENADSFFEKISDVSDNIIEKEPIAILELSNKTP
jgi:hypothetical protein